MKKLILYVLVLFTTLHAGSVYTDIPAKAPPLFGTIKTQMNELIPGVDLQSYFSALIEQESCIYIKHKRCFDPTSRLYAKRKNGEKEEGAGLLQLTRVWNTRGAIRMDTLSYLVRKYPTELKGLSWATVYKRGDLQIKAAFLLWRDNYNRIKRNYGSDIPEIELIAFTDAAYNGGYGGVSSDIRKCMRTKGCNPKLWFGHVEKTCTKSRRILYSNMNACDINRHHVRQIFFKRFMKYHYYHKYKSIPSE